MYVGLDVLTPVVTKVSIFWKIMPYGPLTVKRSFEKNMSPIASGSRIIKTRNQNEAVSDRRFCTEDGSDSSYEKSFAFQRTVKVK
jgi:hypothetical protein